MFKTLLIQPGDNLLLIGILFNQSQCFADRFRRYDDKFRICY